MPTGVSNYQKGCIYKIWSPLTDKIYIGSTCNMTKRWSSHKCEYKGFKNGKRLIKCNSFVLFDLVGVDNCNIEWIKDFPSNSKKELEREEGIVMRLPEHKDFLVNKYIAGRTIKEYGIEYREKNKVQISYNKKEYSKNNREQLREIKKQTYIINREQILEKQRQKYTCVCGSTICKGGKTEHERSQKHLNNIS